MNSFQRVIKYCATAFAIILAVAIISSIANLVFSIASFGRWRFTPENRNRDNNVNVDFDETFTDVTSLDIQNISGTLRIKTGDSIRVEATDVSDDFTAKVTKNGELVISEDEDGIHFFGFHFSGFGSPNSKITLYLPNDFMADEVKIDTGAGDVTLENLQTDYLYISAGAGNINGYSISASRAKIDGGLGNVKFVNAVLKNADLDNGMGNLEIEGVLFGDSKIDCGIGNVNLKLFGDEKDYYLDIDSGIGTIRLNGSKISAEYKKNKGALNSIEIDGGIGDVTIDIDN